MAYGLQLMDISTKNISIYKPVIKAVCMWFNQYFLFKKIYVIILGMHTCNALITLNNMASISVNINAMP